MILLLLLLVTSGCLEAYEIPDEKDRLPFDLGSGLLIENLDSIGILNAKRKAYQLANIKWSPLKPIPWNHGYFKPGGVYSGVPYSSVKQINTYIGLDVSFHTFMTAVHNPRSVLYTSNLSEPPYCGVNCATYYGTVCSTAVDYALGLDMPYTARMFPSIPGMEYIESQWPTDFRPSDVLVMNGHVIMIYDVKKNDNGQVTDITTFETGSYLPIYKHFTVDNLAINMAKQNMVAYRYSNISKNTEYVPTGYVPLPGENVSPVEINNDLCLNKGDKSMYRTDESIVVNIMSNNYDSLLVFRNETLFESYYIDSIDINLGQLPDGKYYACLKSGSSKLSRNIRWEVGLVSVALDLNDQIKVSFNSRTLTPVYLVLCSDVGGYYIIHNFSEQERKDGCVLLDPLDKINYYCKVCFKGEYGTLFNLPIMVQ